MEVKSTELTISNVLDQYYSWLVKLMQPKGRDRVALFSSVLTHDVVKDAPLYTEGVFRGFVDRTITISPEDFGAGNTTDRYSRRYADLINIAGYELYANATYTPKQTDEIQKADGDVSEALKEINSTRKDANTEWVKQAEQLQLKPGTPEYNLERANFYEPYLGLIRDQRQKMTKAQAKKAAVMQSVFGNDQDAAQLSKIYERCLAQDNIQYLPTDPSIESTYHLDPIKIGEAAQSGLYPFESELGVDPSGSLIRMLNSQGVREISIYNSTIAEYKHDDAWHVSGGSSSWIPVFSADVGVDNEHHFRESIKNIESITISCDYMGEYWVRRRDWFDSTIFENKYVKKFLGKKPELAALLSLCTSSVLIVRGLKVTYKFKSVDDTTIWSHWDAHGGGGFSAWGFNFGLSAGGSGDDYSHVVDTAKKSVTFMDGQDVCRLVALRASKINPSVPDNAIAFYGKWLDESEIGMRLIKAWSEGTVSYGLIPDAVSVELAPSHEIIKEKT